MSIYDDVMDELKDRGSYKHETYAPFYISSFAIHQFNLMNQKRKVYWVGKDVPNSRLHILFVSPAGYMKSYFMKLMAGTEYSIFRGSDTKIGYEQEMTSPAFTGTAATHNGVKTRFVGAAEDYKNGILLIDEFKGLTDALATQGNGQMESQLLGALDSGKIVKRLSNERIEYDTSLTMWTGVQPAKFDISSGLGRRLCYLLFIPTRKDNENLLDAMHHARGMKPDQIGMRKLWNRQKAFIKDLNTIETITFTDDILKAYKQMKIFSYESSFFDNLILGTYLARNGVQKHVEVDLKDKTVCALIEKEKEWRKKINQGVDYIQMVNIINMLGGSADINAVYDEATMVGWNVSQVSRLISEMSMNGILIRRGNKIEMGRK